MYVCTTQTNQRTKQHQKQQNITIEPNKNPENKKLTHLEVSFSLLLSLSLSVRPISLPIPVLVVCLSAS